MTASTRIDAPNEGQTRVFEVQGQDVGASVRIQQTMRNLSLSQLPILLVLVSVTQLLPVASFDARVLSASTRKALVDRAKEINPPSPYAEASWSNRAAIALTPVHLEPVQVFTGDRPFLWNTIDVSCRMTVVELPDKKLWVHSPVSLDTATKEAIDSIGKVAFVVTPNYEHLKFAPEWAIGYPEAQKIACPALMERKPELPWSYEIPSGYRPKGWKGASTESPSTNSIGWDTDILQPLHIDVEKNPFTGRPFFEECIFYHMPTKTLMVTDLWWNYPQDVVPNSQYGRDDTWELAPRVNNVPFTSRLWKTGMDKIYKPFYDTFMVTDSGAYRDIADHILNVWDVETIIPAHGDLVRGKDACRSILSEFFGV